MNLTPPFAYPASGIGALPDDRALELGQGAEDVEEQFAGGLRRSEIVGLACHPEDALDGGWIEFFPNGLLLTLRGKTGWREVEIGRGSSEATCPVVALEAWLKFARIVRGPVFRKVLPDGKSVGSEGLTDKHVARLVKCRRRSESAHIRRRHGFLVSAEGCPDSRLEGPVP